MTGRSVQNPTMDPIQALWYLLLLLKINQTYLIQSKPGCSNYEAITDVLKTSRCPRQLGKNISSPDFESLLHAAGILKLKGATGRIEINRKMFELKLSANSMIVEVQNEDITVNGKRTKGKTIRIRQKMKPPVEFDCDDWDHESEIRVAIRIAKKGYNAAQRKCVNPSVVDSARPTTRCRVSIESESAAESSPAIELRPPPSTRTDVSTSTTREARRVSFDAAEETNTTEANSTNLPGPPSQTNQIIEHAQKLDFTLDPRPCLNNDDGNAGFIQLKNTTSNPLPSDQMKIKIGFAAMVLGYDKSLPSLRKQTIINAASR